MSRPLTRSEKLAWVRLARTPRVGAVTFARLMAEHLDAEEALAALCRRQPDFAKNVPPIAAIAAEMEALEARGGAFLARCEPDYPPLLAQIAAPPPVLAVQGDAGLTGGRLVAVVGARDASAIGLRFAETLAQDLSAAGCIVVSGLARGIDARAHRASLSGGTIAVLGGGLDQPYPPENESLHEEIAARGLLVSDAPLGHSPRARDFPRRNAIIAGMSAAVVVVVASLQSGALMTARAAVDLGREAMAVPGSPLDPRSRGANALIKEGAALIESADDVLAALGNARITPLSAPPPMLEPAPEGLAARVAQVLSPTPAHLNDIARAAGASAAAVAAALVELELSGQALSESGGFVSRPT